MKKYSDQDIINGIRECWKKNSYPPSYEELKEVIGLKSLSSIHARLRVMRNRGLVDFVDGQVRTLEVVADTIIYKVGPI